MVVDSSVFGIMAEASCQRRHEHGSVSPTRYATFALILINNEKVLAAAVHQLLVDVRHDVNTAFCHGASLVNAAGNKPLYSALCGIQGVDAVNCPQILFVFPIDQEISPVSWLRGLLLR